MKRIAFAALAVLVSCQSYPDAAKEKFSESKSCPLAQVEARERKDLRASSFRAPGSPPSDVAADPARLKVWRDGDDQKRKSSDNIETVVEVNGCGFQVFYE